MTLTLDPASEARVQRELESGAYSDPAEVVAHALELMSARESEDDWLYRNRHEIRKKMDESFGALERGEAYTEDQVRAYLEQRRAARNHARATQ